MYKNFMAFENENIQINTSSPTSPNQVKKYTQEVETSSSNPTKVKRVRRSNKCKEVSSLEIGQKLKPKFESDDMNDHRDHILGWMNELWNKWRGHLHAKYVKDKPIQQSLKNVPSGVDKKESEWLVKEHFLLKVFRKVQADPSLPTIEIVEKYCGPQTRSHVFGFGGGVKAKDLKGETSSKVEFFYALRLTREDIKSLNEENKS
ncbi:hypothetical protein MTR67_024487 [Solanum verrucosum]|uniref:Uncharacterized protein n=1 Tax=Solanum verrucosum TaxID=315347 RepID=A0AAF0TSB5_SOLVR|nr:hypothetical protein MTR67_024487 [Solanum verrucosum]